MIAAITALHQNMFLNSVEFEDSADAKFRRILNQRLINGSVTPRQAGRSLLMANFMYGLPQLLLTYAVFSAYVGLALITIDALWQRGQDDIWGPAQKVSQYLISYNGSWKMVLRLPPMETETLSFVKPSVS